MLTDGRSLICRTFGGLHNDFPGMRSGNMPERYLSYIRPWLSLSSQYLVDISPKSVVYSRGNSPVGAADWVWKSRLESKGHEHMFAMINQVSPPVVLDVLIQNVDHG